MSAELSVGFYRIAMAQPERIAVVDPDGSRLTFGELGRRVNRVSRALRAAGLRAGDVVAGILPNGHEYLELQLATGQVGMYFVPVNWHQSPAEIGYILRDSGAKLVVAAAEQARDIPADALPAHRFVVGGAVAGWRPFAWLGSDEPDDEPDTRRFGAIMGYTSGTTGNPKGVKGALPDAEPEAVLGGLVGFVAEYGAGPAGVHLVCSPLYHAAPNGHALGYLHTGHTVVIQSKFDPESVLRDVERYRVTTSHLVPTHFHRLLRLPRETRRRYDLSSLQALIHAGAPCPVPIKQQMLDWVGPIIWEYLASTEGSVSRVSPQEWIAKPGTVGRPLPGLTVQILSPEGTEVPRGEPGMIYFGYPGLAPVFEYHHDPAKTAAGRHGNLITAGDYGYFDADGYLFMLDRRTDLIISGGVNIYPAEIEQHLLTHPLVNDVAVIGVPDPEWGSSVLAVVQPSAGAAAGEGLAAILLAYCGERLAPFKRPRRIEFVADFPRTETGKVQRRVLRERFAHAPSR
jgi:long-chain acyl-CoA synthetase